LIEKAYAKVHVNYEMISSGTHAEAARFLTGAPAKEFSSNIMAYDEVWYSISNAVRNNYVVTSACFIEWKGLVAGNGYIVKGVTQIQDAEGKNIRLVKVRNPWKQIGDTSYKGSSHGDWTGRFSADDSSWTDDLKTKANYGDLKKSEFYMTVEDFKQGFKYFTITYLRDDWKTSFLEKRSSVNRRLYKFNFTITEDDYGLATKKPAKKALLEEPSDQENLQMSEQSLLEQL
jgi:hypothetical protein